MVSRWRLIGVRGSGEEARFYFPLTGKKEKVDGKIKTKLPVVGSREGIHAWLAGIERRFYSRIIPNKKELKGHGI